MVKIFSNFDTAAPTKNYADAVQLYWCDKVIFLRRHKLYFFLHTIVPGFFAAVLLSCIVGMVILLPHQTNNDDRNVFYLIIESLLFLISIYLIIIARSRYFNYTLDYTIITPTTIASYDQTWLLTRKITTVDTDKIKTINFSSKWLINSIFNFGNIEILLEWDDEWRWEIIIDFIYNPEGIKEQIILLTAI